jgi:hypothetical protein
VLVEVVSLPKNLGSAIFTLKFSLAATVVLVAATVICFG